MFDFDFSEVNRAYMQTNQITDAEVKSVFVNQFSNVAILKGKAYLLLIGYSVKRKMLTILFDYSTDIAEIRILDVILSYEDQIRKIYCGKN